MINIITKVFLFIMELFANIEIIYNIYFSGYLQNIIMLFNNKKIVPLEYIYVKEYKILFQLIVIIVTINYLFL